MKAKEGFLLRNFGEDYVVVATGDGAEDFNKLITLNSVGAFIFKALDEEITRDALVEKVIDHYEIDRITAERDCDIFIKKLSEAGLLDA